MYINKIRNRCVGMRQHERKGGIRRGGRERGSVRGVGGKINEGLG